RTLLRWLESKCRCLMMRVHIAADGPKQPLAGVSKISVQLRQKSLEELDKFARPYELAILGAEFFEKRTRIGRILVRQVICGKQDSPLGQLFQLCRGIQYLHLATLQELGEDEDSVFRSRATTKWLVLDLTDFEPRVAIMVHVHLNQIF